MAADLFATSLLVITIEIKDLAKRWMAKLPNNSDWCLPFQWPLPLFMRFASST